MRNEYVNAVMTKKFTNRKQQWKIIEWDPHNYKTSIFKNMANTLLCHTSDLITQLVEWLLKDLPHKIKALY